MNKMSKGLSRFGYSAR